MLDAEFPGKYQFAAKCGMQAFQETHIYEYSGIYVRDGAEVAGKR
jgi:hypothetical protein